MSGFDGIDPFTTSQVIDLPNSSTLLHCILFADDTNVFLSHASHVQLFELVSEELKATKT
jgi:hypothetical protein